MCSEFCRFKKGTVQWGNIALASHVAAPGKIFSLLSSLSLESSTVEGRVRECVEKGTLAPNERDSEPSAELSEIEFHQAAR